MYSGDISKGDTQMTKYPENWYEFRAYNTQVEYGYGTADAADAYCDKLNADRDINCFGAYVLTADQAAEMKLEQNSEAVNLDDEMAEVWG